MKRFTEGRAEGTLGLAGLPNSLRTPRRDQPLNATGRILSFAHSAERQPHGTARKQDHLTPISPEQEPQRESSRRNPKEAERRRMGDAAKFLSALTDLNEKIEGVSLTQGTDTRAHREARTYYEKQRHALFVEKAASLGFLQLAEKALEEQGQVVVTRTYSGREAKRKANELRKNVNAYAKTLATDLEPFGGKDAAKELQRTAIQIAKAAFGNIDPWERHDKVKKRVQKTMLYGTTLVTLLGAAVGYRLLRGANVAPGTGTSQVDKTPTKREPTPSTTPTTVVEQSPNLNQAEVNWLNGTTKVNDNERFVMANGQPGGEMQRCTIVGSEVP